MCEYCGTLGRHNNIILELKNLNVNPAKKYVKAIESLTKALGYDSERQQKEVSPFKSVRDLENLSKNRVESHLLKLYNMIVSKWIGTEKAQTDPFVLSGRIFLNPKTGKPLTKKQWAVIKREILQVFNYIYSFEEERIASHALALGKVLKGMSIKDSLSMGYKKIKSAVDATMKKLEGPLWNNSVDFAQQHAGELIVDLTQTQYKKIHDTIQTSIKNRQSHTELKKNLFERFGEMNRDWRRIAETEIGNAQNNGQLITELERADKDEVVFMRGVSSSGACPFCRGEVDGKVVVLLPEPPEGGGDQVVIEGTTYTAIWPGKDNYGRRRADWWVSASTQHPHCRCTWVKYVPGFEDIDAKFRASMEAAMRAGEKRQKPITDREKLKKPTPWED